MTDPALLAWQDVVTCHPDLRNKSADYAIHLGDVLRGAPHCPTLYKDPQRFFAASYPAAQLVQLLEELHARLHGDEGARVLRLQAGFGGGKSHTLLALYHWCKDNRQAALPTDWSQFPQAPIHTRVAALSGLDFDPHTGITPPDGPTCHTLWGAIAWALGGQEAWDTWATHDEARTAPGGALLQTLLQSQPTLLLLDELLLYIEKTQAIALGDSTFGKQNLLFLQTLTEVVRGQPHAAMVYTLQSSATEAAGASQLLDTLAHLSQRLESQRHPLQAHEFVQVLRRRLFADLGDPQHHSAAASAYRALWQGYDKARRRKSKTLPSHEELIAAYPFHPTLLHLLTQQWWEIPTYQRTRGALQLLTQALLSPELPRQPLLTPGALPLASEWRQRLWAQLGAPPAFEKVLDYELTREESAVQRASEPLHEHPRPDEPEDTAEQAAKASKRTRSDLTTSLTTTLLLYSFGGQGASAGILASDCCRACLHPGIHPALLDSTWQRLREHLGYLHETRSRLRLRTAPNLLHQLAQEGTRWSQDELEAALQAQLKASLKGHKAAHLWPQAPASIPDGQPQLQFVYLDLSWRELAPEACGKSLRKWLGQRTPKRPRQYRNGIVVLQPSAARWPALEMALREWLSLEAIAAEPSTKMSKTQARQHQARQERLAHILPTLALQLYQTLWYPQAASGALDGYEPAAIDLSSWRPSPESPTQHVVDALVQEHRLSHALTPARAVTLAASLHPDNPGAPFTTKQLQDAFFCYLHFPRIASLTPLNNAIDALVESGTWQFTGPWPAPDQRRQPQEGWGEDVTLQPTLSQNQDATKTTPEVENTSASDTQLTLSLHPSAAQLPSLLSLLKRIDKDVDATSICIKLELESAKPLSKRWKSLVVEDSLEELGILYEWEEG